ncbi:hypothetical protein SBOR_3546 [Sclerotinia borealis F-4128]|uniref:Uncharacterized protein n=1 Tax=Sclerotinia borealis (strain F-4128) TaxID=1432307 RepID=W9CN40_SCLBF|nr:hypothetical protein SBOR_3546 [Sclerotinia borealis F-4128]
METPAMQAPPIPYATRPVSAMPLSLMSLPSLKEYMVNKLVDEGTHVSTMEDALRDYDSHRRKMEEVCSGASESTITFMADKLFWRAHWPLEEYPGESCFLTPHDQDVIHKACAKIRIETAHARHAERYREQVQRCRDMYSQEARVWSKNLGDKLAKMTQKEEQIEGHNAEENEEKLGLQALSQLKIGSTAEDMSKPAPKGWFTELINASGTDSVRPTEEFPGKKAWIIRDKKKDKDEVIVAQIKIQAKQKDTRNRQNKITISPLPQPMTNASEPPEITKPQGRSQPRQNTENRDWPKAKSDAKTAIDWGIIPIQRRKERRRQLKRSPSSKKSAAKESARVLAKHLLEASTSREQPQTLENELDRARPVLPTTQLQRASLTSDMVAMNTHEEDSDPRGESEHSSKKAIVHFAPAPSGQLQTLDEMIEEEGEIARQLNNVHDPFLDLEENRSIRQNGDELGEVGGSIKRAPNERKRFCVVL